MCEIFRLSNGEKPLPPITTVLYKYHLVALFQYRSFIYIYIYIYIYIKRNNWAQISCGVHNSRNSFYPVCISYLFTRSIHYIIYTFHFYLHFFCQHIKPKYL